MPKYRQFNAIFIIFLINICKIHMCQSCPTFIWHESRCIYDIFMDLPVHFPSFLVEISSYFFRICKMLVYGTTIIRPKWMVMHCSTSEHSYSGDIIMDNLVPVYNIMIIKLCVWLSLSSTAAIYEHSTTHAHTQPHITIPQTSTPRHV